jgi:predicted nucleic acid-binding protein
METASTLIGYMNVSHCLSTDSQTAELGLRLASKHGLGGRDALILASYSRARQIKKFVTMDNSLLALGQLVVGRKKLVITSP